MMMNSIVQLGEWVKGYAIIEFVSGKHKHMGMDLGGEATAREWLLQIIF
jgi:hypothetical protein